jgi:hypothetical protein
VPAVAAEWLAADLARLPAGMRVFLFVHFPQGADAFKAVVARHRIAQIFHGHDHVDRGSSFGSVPCLSSGSLSQVFGDADRATGYRLVHVTGDGIDTFYRTTGQPHAVTIDFPRGREYIGRGSLVRGAFYDPQRAIERLTVRAGEAEVEVPFERGPVCCRFAAALPIDSIAGGIRPLFVTLEREGETWQAVGSAFVLSERSDPLPGVAGATLECDVGGIDSSALLHVNGELLAELKPTALKGDGPFAAPVKGTEVVRVGVPCDRLRRFNRVELRSRNRESGGVDRFCALDARLLYAGQTFRDPRFPSGEGNPRTIEFEQDYWIDLVPKQ